MPSRRPWKGDVDLVEFLPPIQAALSVSRAFASGNSGRDVFPDSVPRMRTFCSQVNVMASKAKPKRLKAFVVPASRLNSRDSFPTSADAYKRAQPGDTGELHFLVKQEAKGDLRKDARVQDLNNVINRLLATSTTSQGGGSLRQKRRLQLRTYAVTCLSEDCGILEWIPDTESIRSLIGKTYNPQAAPTSERRRGRRLANFSDPSMKADYERCQDAFFKDGDLNRATSSFEKLCLEPYPPLFYWWFVQNFMDPHSWYEARIRFTLSAAAWSGVGHVIGLGDRHAENILIDSKTGECVHVDFDWYVTPNRVIDERGMFVGSYSLPFFSFSLASLTKAYHFPKQKWSHFASRPTCLTPLVRLGLMGSSRPVFKLP
jgi:serine/threonine-protein kinase ATR